MSSAYDFDKESKFLGKRVGFSFPFLAQTSCMEREDRLNIAYCEIFIIYIDYAMELGDLSQTDKKRLGDFKKFLEKLVKPSLEKMGFAKWRRNELTDLSLRTAIAKRRGIDFRKVKKK